MDDPALLFHDPADHAGTHVLLVGISDYPWLEGGGSYAAADHEANAMGMGQLAAPAISMRRMADWFFDRFANPDQPLASLALVLSEPDPATYAHPAAAAPPAPLPRGTISEVQDAVAAWVKRAAGRGDNALVFGFCGHGVQSGNAVLLCRDYGRNTEDRFQGAIDFEQFRIALSTRRPDTQLLLVDACRTPDLENSLLGQATPGNALLGMQSLAARDNAPAMQSVHFATSLYTEAWGRNDGPSLFTEAVLKGLDGGAAEHSADWWVTTSRLHTVLSTYLQLVGSAEGVVQRPAAQTQDFRISKPGKIAVDVCVSSREPAIWRESVTIRACRDKTVASTVSHAPPPDSSALTGFRGCTMQVVNPSQDPLDVMYEVQAEFSDMSEFQDCARKIIAYPPMTNCELPVSRRP